jgi:hypothetical protein
MALIFIIAILGTLIPDSFPQFFGDWKCNGSVEVEAVNNYRQFEGCHYRPSAHEPSTHWGYRHWLWAIMSLTLFAIQVVKVFSTKMPK